MKLFQIILQVAVWAFSFYILAPAPIGFGQYGLEIFIPEHRLIFLSYGYVLNIILVYTYAYLALPPYSARKSISYFFLINLAYLLVFTLLESGIDYWYQHYIYDRFPYPNTQLLSFANWTYANVVINMVALIGANLYGFTFAFLKEQRLRRQLETEKLEAELSALKHQVNPHFLFNVLNSLYGLALKNDDEETGDAIMQLSEMMRYMLYESNDNKVPLKKELEYLSNYIKLQRLRLNDQAQIRFKVEGNWEGREIAPLMMIPFIENACKHGVSTVFPSEIDIFIRISEKKLFLFVKNPIHPSQERLYEKGGIGLENVYKRLELFYPQSHELSIQEDEKMYEVSLTLTL